MLETKTESILGYLVFVDSREACADAVAEWLRSGSPGNRWLACINPHSCVLARSNDAFAYALQEADWLIPDGVGIVIASRLLGGRIRARVTGSDVFHGVNSRLNEMGGSVFFLGATEETLSEIRARMPCDYPAVRIVGTYSPPFKSEFSRGETDAMIAAVNAAKPDVLWVGMTAPKQDLWIYENRTRLNVKFAAGVGAVFDFYTGRVRRSHPVFQKLGLEWLPRLLQEPRRLWRRMFVSAPIFLWDVLRARLKGAGQSTGEEKIKESERSTQD